MNPPSEARRRLELAVIYLVLALVGWGLFAFDRGLFQDDAAHLAVVAANGGGFFARVFQEMGSPTRRLLGAPYAVALATGAPLPVLQLLGFLSWLGIALAAHLAARALFPGSRLAPFAAGALTLTASSDLLTGSLVALGYDLSILAFVLALFCLLRAASGGKPGWLAGAVLLLSASVWTTDAAAPAALLAPGLLALGGRARFPRRGIATALWYAAFAPYLVVLLRALLDPSQYVASAILPLSLGVRLLRLAKLFAWNFTPFLWALARRTWFPSPAPTLPLAVKGGLALLAALLFLRGVRGAADEDRRGAAGAWGLAAAACLLLALASNAALASVAFADVCYRTHLLSRVFASLAIAGATAALAAARPRLRFAAIGVPLLFVAFGAYGALERQDWFLGMARRHRAELLSIRGAAPGLAPGTDLLFYVPPGTRGFRATHVPYLAQSWTSLLYGRNDVAASVFCDEIPARCRVEEGGLACDAAARSPVAPERVPLADLVVLAYEPSTGTYRLARRLPDEMAASPADAAAYRPEARIVAAPPGPLATGLLEDQGPFARLLPAGAPPLQNR